MKKNPKHDCPLGTSRQSLTQGDVEFLGDMTDEQFRKIHEQPERSSNLEELCPLLNTTSKAGSYRPLKLFCWQIVREILHEDCRAKCSKQHYILLNAFLTPND